MELVIFHMIVVAHSTSPCGTGKTFVYNTLHAKIRSMGKIAICVASSGTAALLLEDVALLTLTSRFL
jgi:hypothetical protein